MGRKKQKRRAIGPPFEFVRVEGLRFDYRYDLSESAQSCKPNVHPDGP